MVFPLTPFPYTMTPLSNITAASYQDGTTFMRELAYLKDYLTNTLHPEISAEFTRIIEDFQAGITNAEGAVDAAETTWQERFDTFMADLTAQVALLNDNAVAGMVTSAVTATGIAVRALLTPANLDSTVTTLINNPVSGAGVAARALITTVGVARSGFDTEVRTLVDDQVSDTKDAVVSSLLGSATATRAGVDARVTVTADAAVTANLGDPDTGTARAARTLVDATPVHAAGTRAVHVGQVREQVSTARYSAFPSVTKLADGRLFMVWYEATDHITTRDGIVAGAYSSDQGRTWTAKHEVLALAGLDLRDPTVSTSRDGETIYLTYIRCTAAAPRDGYFLKTSTDNGTTWGAAARIDPAGSNGAGTGPVVELANGTLFATWFGMEAGETFDSIYYATSADGGATWGARVKLLNGVADGRHYNEPFPAVYGDTIAVMFRWGENDGIGRVVTSNNGLTWSAPARSFNGSGRPSCLFTSNGTLLVVYRNNDSATANTQHGMLRTAANAGATWTQPKLVEPGVGGWWVYSWLCEVAPGMVYTASAVELSTTATEVSGRYLTVGSGVSPFGDTTPSPLVRAVERRTSLAAVDTFDRADSTALGRTDNGLPWASAAATAQVLSGAMQNHTGEAGLHVINIRTPNQEVEAELSWETAAGLYLVFRYADSLNYWMAGTELNGTVFRIYKIVAGVAALVEDTPISYPPAVYHRVKVVNLADTIRVSVEGVPVFSTVQAGAPNGNWAGIRIGATGNPSAVHRARNFIAHRRSGFAG